MERDKRKLIMNPTFKLHSHSFPDTVRAVSGYYQCVSVIFSSKGQGKVNFSSVGSSPLFLFRNGDRSGADIN